MTSASDPVREVIARAAELPIYRRVLTGQPIDGYTKEIGEEIRDTILFSLREGGWAVVPVEPTEAMIRAGRDHAVPRTQGIGAIYRAMIARSEG